MHGVIVNRLYLEKLTFTISLQRSVPLLISGRQLTLLIFELLQLLEFRNTVHVTHLIVQCKECHRRVNSLSTLGTQSHNLRTNHCLLSVSPTTRNWRGLLLVFKQKQ